MKGKHLVIGIILFVIVIVAAIYFAVMAEYNKGQNGMEPATTMIEIKEANDIN